MKTLVVGLCALVIASVACVSNGCRDVTSNLVSDPGSEHDASRAMLDAGVMPKPDAAAPRARCAGMLCACDDGLDNDHDGLIDGLDPECTGAFDNDEKSFATGTPKTPGMCLDCFWDDNGKMPDALCRYPHECLDGKLPPGKGMGMAMCGGSCDVSSECVASCLTNTPNGCDCFGCCAISKPDGSSASVAIGDMCSLDKLDDKKACPPCVQSSACLNTCGRCELCPGRSAGDLPVDCAQGSDPTAQPWSCDSAKRCSATADCGGDFYCQQGCCLPVVL